MTNQNPEWDARWVMSVLPHRYPMLLIDRVLEMEPKRRIRALKNFTINEEFFSGHFPEHPVVPGVLLIEAMAQTSGWLVTALTGFQRMPFLAAVKGAKLRSFVLPGQVLSLTAELLHDGSGYAVTKAAAKVGGKQVCDAEITLRVMPFPNPDLQLGMRETAKRIGFPMERLTHG